MTNVYKWASLALLAVVAGQLVYNIFFKVETPYQVDLAAVQADIERLRGELAEREKLLNSQVMAMDASLKLLDSDLGAIRAGTSAGLKKITDKLTEMERAKKEIDDLDAAALDARFRELVRRYQAEE